MTESTQDEKNTAHKNMLQDVQTRVWSSLKSGYKYNGTADHSEEYLGSRVSQRLDLNIMYVDLVGSTLMSLEISQEKFVTIISSFAHEMAHVVQMRNGYVLKFVGDAVLAYFPNNTDSADGANNALNCAITMIETITQGMNPILNQYDYPDLKIKIGIDAGQVVTISYGSEDGNFPIDLIGPPMNIAAKIQSLAKPNQILVGYDVYKKLQLEKQSQFKAIELSSSVWRYHSRVTGDMYGVYEYQPT
ncbi:MAG: adenylate/guanylate cyclase [Cenarchaeum symbiont of Oopsacas minuta]|nr:adenylate/guanylate cyclase [Cenarchaeum symbiont of Oopsacas minuta]